MGVGARGRVPYTYSCAMGDLNFAYLTCGEAGITQRRAGFGSRSMYQVLALYCTLIRLILWFWWVRATRNAGLVAPLGFVLRVSASFVSHVIRCTGSGSYCCPLVERGDARGPAHNDLEPACPSEPGPEVRHLIAGILSHAFCCPSIRSFVARVSVARVSAQSIRSCVAPEASCLVRMCQLASSRAPAGNSLKPACPSSPVSGEMGPF